MMAGSRDDPVATWAGDQVKQKLFDKNGGSTAQMKGFGWEGGVESEKIGQMTSSSVRSMFKGPCNLKVGGSTFVGWGRTFSRPGARQVARNSSANFSWFK